MTDEIRTIILEDGKKYFVKTCPCGKDYYILSKYKGTLEARKYCSKKCSDFHNRKRIEVECAFCHKKYEIMRCRFEKNGRKKTNLFFCCMEHKYLSQRLNGYSELHPSQYTTLEDSKYYRSKMFYTVEKKCNRCGYDQEEQMLDVHHKDGDRSNNKIENLEILCLWCHALATRGVEPHGWDGQLPEETPTITVTEFFEIFQGASGEGRTRS